MDLAFVVSMLMSHNIEFHFRQYDEWSREVLFQSRNLNRYKFLAEFIEDSRELKLIVDEKTSTATVRQR